MAGYNLPQRMFKPVGRCIYCGSDGTPLVLTREHIFPFSLGGTLVLPKASCHPCSRITRDFEQTISRTMFGRLRILFDLPTQHKEQRPTELPLDIEVDGVPKTIMVPVSDHPSVPVVFPVFPPPGLLRGAQHNAGFPQISGLPVLPAIPDHDARIARIRSREGGPLKIFIGKETSRTNVPSFVRLLAKIAHSHAVAEFGIESFTPWLTGIILGTDQNIAHFVGCVEPPAGLSSPALKDGTHRLQFALVQAEYVEVQPGAATRVVARSYFGAFIKLFKDMGTPAYFVVIGDPSPDLERVLLENPLPEGQVLFHGIADGRPPEGFPKE